MTEHINFCLTFETALANFVTSYARRLSHGLATDYVLSPEVVPHVSVLKLNADPLQMNAVWQRLLPVLPTRLSLRFYGMCLLPGKSGDVWLKMNVMRSAELMLLQEMAVKHLREFGIRSSVGDSWWPHVTMVHSVDGRLPADLSLDRSLLNMDEVIVRPSLGRDVPPGRMSEILQRVD